MNATILFLGILAAALAICAIILLIRIVRFEKQVASLTTQLNFAEGEGERVRAQFLVEAETLRGQTEVVVKQLQAQYEQEILKLQGELRQHYESEALLIRKTSEENFKTERSKSEALKKYEGLIDVEQEAQRVLAEALNEANALKIEAQDLLGKARTAVETEKEAALAEVKRLRTEAEALLGQAFRDAQLIVSQAKERAASIGGEAYTALENLKSMERSASAIKNVLDGYGDRYLIPNHSLLDDLAGEFGHTAAGESLRAAREITRNMVEKGEAAECDYIDSVKRDTAIHFVIDAFNGRVDAILSRCKHDNYGSLAQEIRDAFTLVNHNATTFRNARIKEQFLNARLAELKWAVVVHELRMKDREEQRRIKEQIREEEKARREYERAIREAAKEQDLIRKAMETAKQQIEQANAEQKAKYEEQLQLLSQKLQEAEERNRRAISMAQQTKRGHVYIISNIGSFGENIYKIGLTRRLEPLDRIWELGDSSVPFDFDVHALIFAEDAPSLETKLHKFFVEHQVNKVNHRKEFFRVDLHQVRTELEKLGVSPKWTMTAAAAEYRETLAIEKVIASNPELRQQWIDRQLELDTIDFEKSDAQLEDRRPGNPALAGTAQGSGTGAQDDE